MELSKTIDSYAVFYCRCDEFLTKLSRLSTEDYEDGKDKELRRLLCYYADLLMIHAEELKRLGLDVDMYEAFEKYAEMWRQNPDLAEVA